MRTAFRRAQRKRVTKFCEVGHQLCDGNYRAFLLIFRRYKTLLGAKWAQRQSRFVELNQVFRLFTHPHNLKVTGSNPVPATKRLDMSHLTDLAVRAAPLAGGSA
jgi:hypothetical protein